MAKKKKKTKRTLSPEQIEKMQAGRKKAKTQRERIARAEEVLSPKKENTSNIAKTLESLHRK